MAVIDRQGGPWRGVALKAVGVALVALPSAAGAACGDSPNDRPIYLSFETGPMNDAELIADVLNRQGVKATFFVADDPQPPAGSALDDASIPWWNARAAEGHAFGARIAKTPARGGAYCDAIQRSATRFHEVTGRSMAKIYRAGDKLAPALTAAAEACGWVPVVATTVAVGDDLPSRRYPNKLLLDHALREVRPGDIVRAHLGGGARRVAWAPANIEPLIVGLKARGMCFATLREHPAYRAQFAW